MSRHEFTWLFFLKYKYLTCAFLGLNKMKLFRIRNVVLISWSCGGNKGSKA